MKPDGEQASEILERVSDLLNYELLVSTPGIKEPDSNFMWASRFRAPVGINVIQDEVSFNLFLPEGAENEKDKKLFFSRVGAKLQDGLWQVRRIMSDLSELYASVIKMAVGQFPSVVLDYSFIQEGRYYSHFTFNESDLAGISATLISLTEVIMGYKIEYLKRVPTHASIFNGVEEIGDVSTVTLEIYPQSKTSIEKMGNDATFFIMANFLDEGVKTISWKNGRGIPDILCPDGIANINGKAVSFKTKNRHVTELVKLIASNFIILYGLYGVAEDEYLKIMLPIPKQQTSTLLKVLNELIADQQEWNVKLCEISEFEKSAR